MTGPTTLDIEQLRAALNLGWSMAELRGRLRYGHVEPPGTVDYQFPREQFHALPIGGEHSLVEQQIATRVAAGLLAGRFGVDGPLPKRKEPASDTVRAIAIELENALGAVEKNGRPPTRPDTHAAGSEVAKAWRAAADAIYYWDAQIQDGLSVSAELHAAYQLGRGLSEAFWALNPETPAPLTKPTLESTASPPHPGSWEFLLGPRRQLMLGTYLALLEGALPPLSGPAVQGPLSRWCKVIADNEVRSHPGDDALEALRRQLQNWREVLLGSRDPTSFAKRFGLRLALRQALRVVQTLPLETALGLVGVALLGVAGYYLGAKTHNTGTAILASVLGFFGVTGAGLLAWAKARAAVLSVRLREAFYRDIVEAQATVLPPWVKS